MDKRQNYLNLRHLLIYAMLGALLFASKKLMEALPNIHLLGLLIMTYTLVYRKYALIPLYLYVLLDGLFAGFAAWWMPYLYIWTVLWGVTMLLPRRIKPAIATPVYALVCGLHGLCFGILYAPMQALLFHLNWQGTLAWIASGFPFDVTHGISNFCVGLLIVPLTALLQKLENQTYRTA